MLEKEQKLLFTIPKTHFGIVLNDYNFSRTSNYKELVELLRKKRFQERKNFEQLREIELKDGSRYKIETGSKWFYIYKQ